MLSAAAVGVGLGLLPSASDGVGTGSTSWILSSVLASGVVGAVSSAGGEDDSDDSRLVPLSRAESCAASSFARSSR